ncbi:MAG: AmmeMemoRadiSam system protein A [Minisyncoccales bacterium]
MNSLVKLAQKAVEKKIREGEKISPPSDLADRFLKEKAGVFVTIKKDNDLKGCLGTYRPTQNNIAKELIENAIAAATKDIRFSKIKKKELKDLSYEVYVLNEPEKVQKLEELDPKKYGVIVKTRKQSFKTGLLLPDLEGIDSIEKQINTACKKAKIDPRKKDIIIYRFTVEKYNE